jgi:hypothetical protein
MTETPGTVSGLTESPGKPSARISSPPSTPVKETASEVENQKIGGAIVDGT